jgi:hypothetical protein
MEARLKTAVNVMAVMDADSEAAMHQRINAGEMSDADVFDCTFRSQDAKDAVAELIALAHQYARECGECGGLGTIQRFQSRTSTVTFDSCAECEHIRTAIAKATGK